MDKRGQSVPSTAERALAREMEAVAVRLMSVFAFHDYEFAPICPSRSAGEYPLIQITKEREVLLGNGIVHSLYTNNKR